MIDRDQLFQHSLEIIENVQSLRVIAGLLEDMEVSSKEHVGISNLLSLATDKIDKITGEILNMCDAESK